MLSRVLLHVVAATGGIDFTADPGSRDQILHRRFEVMDHPAIFGFGNFGDPKSALAASDPASIVELSTAGGIERGAVQDHAGTWALADFSNRRLESVEEGILIVEALSHDAVSSPFKHGRPGRCGPRGGSRHPPISSSPASRTSSTGR